MADGCDGSDKDGTGHTGKHGCVYDWGTASDFDGSDGDGISPHCFPYSSLVYTPLGKVRIGDISVGQIVWSFKNGLLTPRAVTKKLVHGNSKIMELSFIDSSEKVRCTTAHSFLTEKGYLPLSKITIRDSIVRIDSNGQASLSGLASIIDTRTVEPVFNLYTEVEHNFIVDGYVAHNFTHFRLLRTLFHRLFVDQSVLPGTGRSNAPYAGF